MAKLQEAKRDMSWPHQRGFYLVDGNTVSDTRWYDARCVETMREDEMVAALMPSLQNNKQGNDNA